MNGEGTLRLLEPPLAELIRNSVQEETLREFAYNCARFALEATGLADHRLRQALDAASRMETGSISDEELERVRTAVSELAEQLDEAALDQQDAIETGQGSEEAYGAAMVLACAAASVRECLLRPPRRAAAEACYEALLATDDLGSILLMAEKILR